MHSVQIDPLAWQHNPWWTLCTICVLFVPVYLTEHNCMILNPVGCRFFSYMGRSQEVVVDGDQLSCLHAYRTVSWLRSIFLSYILMVSTQAYGQELFLYADDIMLLVVEDVKYNPLTKQIRRIQRLGNNWVPARFQPPLIKYVLATLERNHSYLAWNSNGILLDLL